MTEHSARIETITQCDSDIESIDTETARGFGANFGTVSRRRQPKQTNRSLRFLTDIELRRSNRNWHQSPRYHHGRKIKSQSIGRIIMMFMFTSPQRQYFSKIPHFRTLFEDNLVEIGEIRAKYVDGATGQPLR